MTPTQEQQLKIAQDWCDENYKSTEFMIQYMQDVSGCSYDEVIEYLEKQAI